MAVLQAWPGRGFWQGTAGGQPGTLTGMVQSMSQTSQPHALSALVSSFASFTAAHGFAVNLFIVIALAVLGAAFLTGRPRLVRAAVIAATVLCLADWVLIEDLGFLGGLGTDPNSMIPMILVFTAGYLALTPARCGRGTSRRRTGRGAVAGAAAPGRGPRRRRRRQRPHGRRPRRDRRHLGGRRPDGRGVGEPQRGPDHRRGHLRLHGRARPAGPRLRG